MKTKSLWISAAMLLLPFLGSQDAHSQAVASPLLANTIVGSWECESDIDTPVGRIGLLTTFFADNTYMIATDSNIFGETHGNYRRLSLRRFQSFDKAFIYNAAGFADRVRVARAFETVLTQDTMRIDVDISIEDREGKLLQRFPNILTCKRLLIDFPAK